MKGGCYPFSCLMSTSKLRLETGVKYTVSSLTVVVGASPEAGGGGGKNVPTLGAGMSPRSHQIRPSQKPRLAAAAAEQQEHGFLGIWDSVCWSRGAGFVGKCKCVHGIIKYKR